MSVRGNLIGILALASALFFADKWISAKAFVAPDIVNESDFLRTYNPVPLLNSFRASCLARTGVGMGSSSTPGYRFLNNFKNVHYTRTAEMELCNQDQYPSVLTALHRNLTSALDYAGCKIQADQSTTADGVQITYRCGTRTTGFVSSGPKPIGGNWPSEITLQLNEEWYVRNPS
jgi:hypothetical protein